MFLPILLSVASMLIYPSLLLGGAALVLSWLYLSRGGQRVGKDQKAAIRGQLAYRILSVKTMALNGDLDEGAFKVHAVATPDYAENCNLRALLRDAAKGDSSDWRHWAKVVRSIYDYDPTEIRQRFDSLVVQLTAQPSCRPLGNGLCHLDHQVQDRLVEIAKLWKIGPDTTRTILHDHNVEISPNVSAWR